MADEVFKVGTLLLTDEATAGFLFQNTTPKITSKKDEALDHLGNLAARQNFDHRLVVSVEAVIPRGVAVPVPGQTVRLTGIAVPTFNPDGTVASGSFEALDPDGSGSGDTTEIEMTVDTEATITMQNEKVTRCSFDCERGLINGIPGAGSSSGA